MHKQLASTSELTQNSFTRFMDEMNKFAYKYELTQYDTYSRIWEYPWLWFKLKRYSGNGMKVLDLGSEMSPFPWFLSLNGFDVTVSDLETTYWNNWKKISRNSGLKVRRRILDAQNISLPTSSVDIYLSVSVIEHVPNKTKVIDEAARVLKPGGLLIMTFDICEADMGMTFPEWNGKAITMSEFDELFNGNRWFENGIPEIRWNVEDIDEYLKWHRTTAPHHDYITGATFVKRNRNIWKEHVYKDYKRILNYKLSIMPKLAMLYFRQSKRVLRSKI